MLSSSREDENWSIQWWSAVWYTKFNGRIRGNSTNRKTLLLYGGVVVLFLEDIGEVVFFPKVVNTLRFPFYTGLSDSDWRKWLFFRRNGRTSRQGCWHNAVSIGSIWAHQQKELHPRQVRTTQLRRKRRRRNLLGKNVRFSPALLQRRSKMRATEYLPLKWISHYVLELGFFQ